MQKPTKWLAVLLACLTVFPLSACGTNVETPQESTSDPSTEVATEVGTDFYPKFGNQDYQGATFHMISNEPVGTWYYADAKSESDGDVHVLDDTLYEMNTIIEEKLTVNLTYEYLGGHLIYNKVQPSLMAGDDAYQLLILHPYYGYTSFISQNYALDLQALPDFDMSQPYWNTNVMEKLAINDHTFIGLGDMCMYLLDIIYCNKDLLQNASMEIPYDKVRNKT